MTLVIHDEKTAELVREKAKAVGKSTDDFIREVVEGYEPPPQVVDPDKAARLRRVYLKAYTKARVYWEKAGDAAKAALTDEQLDEQFAYFDAEGVPRLKSEVREERPAPEPGTGRYLAMALQQHGGVHAGGNLDVTQADDILSKEYSDYLDKKYRGEHEE